jgi:beta-1,4-mannosyl-glycoprotein beta-1,4-N-acetylglucosaminyltransferase
MIAKKVFDDIGLLDEIFSPGYGEDTDFCLKAEDRGWKQVQVPRPSTDYYADKRMTGDFPIYHIGNETFKDHPDSALIHRNNDILNKRYRMKKPNIEKAKLCDGYMSETELEWLGKRASESNVFIEIGSWHGRSSRAIADNLPSEGKLYCVDHWRGSEYERDSNHVSAGWKEGDHAFIEFCDNLADHIISGKVVPIRMSSRNAAEFFHKNIIVADTIFIDAGHTYDEVLEDIYLWQSLVTPGGMLCGHDYYHEETNIWPGVQQAVDFVFKHKGHNMGYIPDNSIWAHKILSLEKQRLPAVFDCFPFNNELDILEERLSKLYDVVDRFVIVEAKETHSGKPKELNFNKNLQRFERYLNKITYLVIEKFPEVEGSITDKSWARERYQRDFIMNALKDCQDNDIIIVSDCDEIPYFHIVGGLIGGINDHVVGLEMDLYYYDRNTKAKDKWLEAKATTYRKLKQLGPCGLRYHAPEIIVDNAGEHLSYFGGVESVIAKIENTAHQEYNTPEMKDPQRIAKAITEGTDVFGREYVKFIKTK